MREELTDERATDFKNEKTDYFQNARTVLAIQWSSTDNTSYHIVRVYSKCAETSLEAFPSLVFPPLNSTELLIDCWSKQMKNDVAIIILLYCAVRCD